MEKRNDKKNYQAPMLTVVAFSLEKGYAVSLRTLAVGELQANDYGDDHVEDRVDGGYWGNNENGWF